MNDIPVYIDHSSGRFIDLKMTVTNLTNLPSEIGKLEVENFLSFLENERQPSKSTQKTALNALIFLYREFLQIDLGKLSFNLSQKHRRIPVVFSAQEANCY